MRAWLLLLLLFPLALTAQRIDDPNGFSFQPPAGFKAFAGELPVPGPRPQYVFAGSPEGARGLNVLLGIAYLEKAVYPGDMPKFPDDLNASIIREKWNDLEVFGIRTNHAESQVIAWVDLPLTQPIRIGVHSINHAEVHARQALRLLLRTIEGSVATKPEGAVGDATGSEGETSTFGAALLVVLVMGVIGLAGWMLLNRKNERPVPVNPEPMPLPIPDAGQAPLLEPPKPPEPARKASAETQTIQPPWAITKDSPNPETGSDVPPWETKP
ncbi:MAG: hypothetical protein IPK87_10705 [Planctomycetes bacterium]|nr:hypothetical protein [Planctomycetota bacterium]